MLGQAHFEHETDFNRIGESSHVTASEPLGGQSQDEKTPDIWLGSRPGFHTTGNRIQEIPMSAPENKRFTDVEAFIRELDGGVFMEKLARALSEVAGGVMDHQTSGRVKLDFTLNRIGSSFQVNVKHKLEYTVPQMRGKVTEDDTTDTPMYVNTGGRLSFYPENQTDFFNIKGGINQPEGQREPKQ